MKAVIQRVTKTQVKFNNKTSSINKGLLVFLAVGKDDSEEDVYYLSKKIAYLRIMADEKGLMNKSVKETHGEVLVISQFTLYARTRKGNRPSFIDSADPEKARYLYDLFIKTLEKFNLSVKTGRFGKHMYINLINDGPVTIIIDSSDRNKPRSKRISI